MSEYKTTIGLEIHVELRTKRKMFCDCQNPAAMADDISERKPNIFICPVCMGYPGVLPVANKQAIEWTVMTGLALNCKIAGIAKFDRKHYFYPDLPKGFQISQYDMPFASQGWLEAPNPKSKIQKIRIRRVHLEEDAGKLIHPKGSDYSLVDLNRAGTPLLEIVTEPDIESPAQAKEFMQKLRLILRYLGVSDANMEKGHLRCDANIDVSRDDKKSPIVEIKNLNSFKFVEKALTFEEERLIKDEQNWSKKSEKLTRGFDSKSGKTYPQRTKEEASDYRYFPEPDLAPFTFISQDIKKIKEKLPELPDVKRQKFIEKFNLSESEAKTLTSDFRLADFFEEIMAEKAKPKKVANWILTEFLAKMRKSGLNISENKIKAKDFADLVNKIESGELSQRMAKDVFEIMFDSGKTPAEIMKDLDLKIISGKEELEKICSAILQQNPDIIKSYRQGKENVIQYLIGQAMSKTKGKADPSVLSKIFKEQLTNGKNH